MAVPLESFVCNVSSVDCPSNCSCTKRPSDLAYDVSCQPGSQRRLPAFLPDPDYPPPRVGWFHLNFSGSYIRSLELRPYWNRTRSLNVSRSKIRSVPDAMWRVLSQLDHVDLSGNQLVHLPTFLGTENVTFRWLALHQNPLRCNCEDRWIRGWLQSLGGHLFAPCYRSAAVCGSPDWLKDRNIFDMTDGDFCADPNRERTQLIIEVCESQETAIFAVLGLHISAHPSVLMCLIFYPAIGANRCEVL